MTYGRTKAGVSLVRSPLRAWRPVLPRPIDRRAFLLGHRRVKLCTERNDPWRPGLCVSIEEEVGEVLDELVVFGPKRLVGHTPGNAVHEVGQLEALLQVGLED